MTLEKYKAIFRNVYLVCISICLPACIIVEHSENKFANAMDIGQNLYWPLRSTNEQLPVVFFLLFLLPAIATWSITGVIRLTSKIDKNPEQENKTSFIERQSKLQLFVFLSFLMLLVFIPTTFDYSYLGTFYNPAWLCYVVAVGFAIISFLLAWFLHTLSTFKKLGVKVIASLIFIVGVLLCEYGIYFIFSSTRLTQDSFNASYYSRDEEEDGTEFTDTYHFNTTTHDKLAKQQFQNLMTLCNNDFSKLLSRCSPLIHYNPDEMETNGKANGTIKDQLACFYFWLFYKIDDDTFNNILNHLLQTFIDKEDSCNYESIRSRQEMLEIAYYAIDSRGESGYADVYSIACSMPYKWENYKQYITDPYADFLISKQEKNKQLFMWALTFWGRRYKDGSLSRWQQTICWLMREYPTGSGDMDESLLQDGFVERAEAQVEGFIQWYEANYWAFKELKVVEYDEDGDIKRIDTKQFEKYLRGLEQSGYISPNCITKLKIKYGPSQVESADLSQSATAQWFRTDPLTNDLNFKWRDDRSFNTKINKLSSDMTVTIDKHISVHVERVNHDWLIYKFEQKKK